MNSDNAQVRALLAALAKKISSAPCFLNGQAIADALYGLRGDSILSDSQPSCDNTLSGLREDCPELRSLLAALGDRIDASRGKLESQEIGNALYGLQSLSSEYSEVKVIVAKLAEKLKRSRAYLRPQHISRAFLGLQQLTADSLEVRSLLTQLAKRVAESDRTPLTASSIADALFGLQGMTSDVPEVQEMIGELAKKMSSTAAVLTPSQVGRALFGLQGFSSSPSIFEESALGIDSDEVQFLLSVLWDKIKVMKETIPLASIAMGLQGMILLKDPIASNIKLFLYMQLLQIPVNTTVSMAPLEASKDPTVLNAVDVIAAIRALQLNDLPLPIVLGKLYNAIEERHMTSPVFSLSRQDRLISQRYINLHPGDNQVATNVLLDGFRIDMLFLDIDLAVELDSPAHKLPARARFDRVRDNYLSDRLGLKV